MCGLVHQVHHVTKPALPLKAYADVMEHMPLYYWSPENSRSE